MDHTTMLVNLLKLHFGWHLARIKCLASIIVALFKIKTVNLTEVATAFPGTAEIESHYKRLQRFFKQVEIKALVQFDGERYVIEIAGQIGLSLSYVIDPINPKMKAMTWTFYDSSAQYATLLIFNIIRPIPQRIMVAVSLTNVSTVRSISPRQSIPSWKV